MGRKKITIKPIDCPRLRSVTFYKRRKGLLKKAMELAVLCQSHVFLAFVDNETGKLVTFNSHSVKALRDLFRKTPLHLRENFKAQDYDFLYGDSQTCNKSGKLPQRDHTNIKIEDQDDQVFDQMQGGSGEQQQSSSRTVKRNAKRNSKIGQKILKSSQRCSGNLQQKSNEVKQCDNDSQEDKEFGFLDQQNYEGDLFQQSDMFVPKQQQQQQQSQAQKHLMQYQNEDNSQLPQNIRFGTNQFDQSRVGGQVTHQSNLKLNEINDMMNLFQEDKSNQYQMSRKILNENMHIDQVSSQNQQLEDNQQTPLKGTQRKMKQKLKIQNIDIGDDQKNQSYKLNKLQSFQFMANNFGKGQNKQQPIDDQNSSTATLLQSSSQQLSQNGLNNSINASQTQQLQQQLLNNQAIYQQLKSINPLQPSFNTDLSPYPLLLTPSPFPSSLFLPNLGASLTTPNNPLGMNQPSQLGFDFMNHPLLSSTSPLFQVCQGLFNPQELTPGVGTTTPLQNPLNSKSGMAGLNNIFNNNNSQQNAFSALNQTLNNAGKEKGSESKQLQSNLDNNNSAAAEKATNYYNSILNNLRPQNQGLNLQSLNQSSCLNDNQQPQTQQQQPQNAQNFQSAAKQQQ